MPSQVNFHSTPRWKIHDKRKFLLAVMMELAGDAHLSLEGDLSTTQVLDLPETSESETATLKRNTIWPVQDFVVLPLRIDLIKTIIASIGGTVPSGILHLQIEKRGQLEFGIYDNFGSDTSFFGPKLTSEFFNQLESEGVLRKITEQ